MRNSSINEADMEFEALTQELPEDWEEMAGQFGAIKYKRRVKSPLELLRMALLYSGLDKSLRDVAGNMALLGVKLTDTAVFKRLKGSESWLKALVAKMLKDSQIKAPTERRVIAIDASALKTVGSKGIDYRLHLGLELGGLEFASMQVTNSRKGESFKNYRFKDGDIVLADAAYNCISDLSDLKEREVDVVVRWNHALPLFHRDGTELKLFELLQGQDPESIRSFPVLLKYEGSKTKKKNEGKEVRGYVHVYRMSKEKAEAEQKKKKRQYNRRQKKITESVLFFCQFVVAFTTIDPSFISAEDILDIYRLRWQIELIFKRLKSLLNINKARTRAAGKLTEIYFNGKLLYALMMERLINKASNKRKIMRLEKAERKMTPWRLSKALLEQFHRVISASAHWNPKFWALCLHLMSERPRRRKLQTHPKSLEQLRATWLRLPESLSQPQKDQDAA